MQSDVISVVNVPNLLCIALCVQPTWTSYSTAFCGLLLTRRMRRSNTS